MAEALGAKHEGSDWEGPGEDTDWTVELSNSTPEGAGGEFELTCWPGPKTKACWANLVLSEWDDGIRGPKVSLPPDEEGPSAEKHKRPGPPKGD